MDIVQRIIAGIPLAVAPGIAIIFFIFFRDKYEKEPFRLLWISFLLGALCMIPAFLYELLFDYLGFADYQSLLKTLFYAFFVVGLIEELSKFFALRLFIYPKPAFNEPFDGIVYSVLVSMGFATIENILYTLLYGLTTGVVRMFTAVPLHATCAVIMGYFLGKARFSKSPVVDMLKGIAIAVILHGLYDFFLLQKEILWLVIFSGVTLAAAVGLSFRAIFKLQKKSPFRKEPQSNTIEEQNKEKTIEK